MPVWRLQTTFQAHTAFPRDRIMINPVINDQGPGGDTQSLVDDWADRCTELFASFTGEIRVAAYDCQGSKPVYFDAEAVRNQGVVGNPNAPRELAMCLSFYSERNLPRQRGRLYLPSSLLNITAQQTRPAMPVTVIQDVAEALEALGGLNCDWSVYSERDHTARKVTHWWYDNEWDVVRSRGLRADAREQGTTSE